MNEKLFPRRDPAEIAAELFRSCAWEEAGDPFSAAHKAAYYLFQEMIERIGAAHPISTTDRQPCQRWRACRPSSKALAITACADTVQTRQRESRDNAVSMGISATRPHDGKSRERGFRARSLKTFSTLGRKDGARGNARRNR